MRVLLSGNEQYRLVYMKRLAEVAASFPDNEAKNDNYWVTPKVKGTKNGK